MYVLVFKFGNVYLPTKLAFFRKATDEYVYLTFKKGELNYVFTKR